MARRKGVSCWLMNKTRTTIFSVINASFLIVYLILEWSLIRPRIDYESLNGIDQLHAFIFKLLPVLFLMVSINSFWLFRIKKGRHPRRLELLYWLLVAVSWCFAVQYNGLALHMIDVIWILA